MPDSTLYAPGWPGISPRWTSSAKSGVGTTLSATNHVWFTLSHGIFVVQQTDFPYAVGRFNNKTESIVAGKTLRLESLAAAVVHWSADGWQTFHDTETRDTGLGVYVADLPTAKLPVSAALHFTFYWPTAGRWEGVDFTVEVTTPSPYSRVSPGDNATIPNMAGDHRHDNGRVRDE